MENSCLRPRILVLKYCKKKCKCAFCSSQFCRLLCFLAGVNSQVSFSVEPENTVYVVGDHNPVLYCSVVTLPSGRHLNWYSEDANGSEDNLIFGGAPRYPNKHVTRNDTNLEIKDAVFSDAGTYQCRSTESTTTQRKAELIVLSKSTTSHGNKVQNRTHPSPSPHGRCKFCFTS